MLMRQSVWLTPLVFLLFLPAQGICGEDARKSLQKQLREEIIGKNLVIRNFYDGSLLKYDSGGTLTEGGKPGIWTIHGLFRPTGIKISGQGMEIRGLRLCWAYDVFKEKPVYWTQPSNTRIFVEHTGEPINPPSIREAIHRIFLTDHEPIVDFVPSYWKAFLEAKMGLGIPDKTVAAELTLKPPDGLQFPRQVYMELPGYTKEARMGRLSGAILIKIVVDEEGKASVEEILRPLGAGLEEKAVEAVGKWRFLPALLNGGPVRTPAIVELKFIQNRW